MKTIVRIFCCFYRIIYIIIFLFGIFTVEDWLSFMVVAVFLIPNILLLFPKFRTKLIYKISGILLFLFILLGVIALANTKEDIEPTELKIIYSFWIWFAFTGAFDFFLICKKARVKEVSDKNRHSLAYKTGKNSSTWPLVISWFILRILNTLKKRMILLPILMLLSCQTDKNAMSKQLQGIWVIDTLKYKNENLLLTLDLNTLVFKKNRVELPVSDLYRRGYLSSDKSAHWQIKDSNQELYINFQTINPLFKGKKRLQLYENKALLKMKINSDSVFITAAKLLNYVPK